MTLSIIIPTLNEETVLEKTLGYFNGMTKISKEIIISDGRSTDKTEAIAKKLADQVVVYSGTTRQTIAHARNLGAQAAQGEFLLFMDADVVILNPDDFFKTALNYFDADPKLAGLTVSLKVMPELATRADKIIFGLMNFNYYLSNNIFHRGSAPGEFQLIRRSFFDQVKGYNETMVTYEDFDMFSRLSKVGHTLMAKELVALHTGRRAHKIGWPKLLSHWMRGAIAANFYKKAGVKEWKPIR